MHLAGWGVVIYSVLLAITIVIMNEANRVRKAKAQKHFRIVLRYENGMTRTVDVKASTREVAEHRAMKRNPGAVSIQRSQ